MKALVQVAICSVLASAASIDEEVDELISSLNNFNKFNDYTTKEIPAGSVNEHVSYSRGYLTGWDTLRRTGSCTYSNHSDSSAALYDLHFGLDFFVVTFGRFSIGEEDAASYFKIGDNSLHLGIKYVNETNCTVSITALDCERFGNVSFALSNPDVEDFDFERFFRTAVRNKMNHFLTAIRPAVLNWFQGGLCDNPRGFPSLKTIFALLPFLFDRLTSYPMNQ